MLSASTNAQTVEFKDGPVIMGFGKNAPVSTHTVPNDTVFKVAFDVGSTSDNKDEVNRKFNSLARFINMHVAAGEKRKHSTCVGCAWQGDIRFIGSYTL